jgi:hypothetical protein
VPKHHVEADDPPFVADAPIRSAAEDTLGRKDFAHNLADLVAKWKGDTSLVIAVRSPWGNGKTSVKNMVLEHLRNTNPGVRALQFNPWQYDRAEAITAAFYRELRLALGKSKYGLAAWRRGRMLRRYGRYFTAASKGLTAAGGQVTPILTAMAVFGLGSFVATYFKQDLVLRWGSLAVAVVGALGLLGKLFSFLGSPPEETPQQHVREELEVLLRKLKEPLLVVIDDLDRLDEEAIRLVIRHVKVNADLPNITYLLLFQREIVEAALHPITDGQGRAYLDKIILAPFDLPAIGRERLEKVLFAALDKLLASLPENTGFDANRWGNAYHGGLKYYFHNLRDVHRFAASLAVQMTLHVTAKMVEVNIIDIFILETLRLFEPDVYANIAQNQAFLMKAGAMEEADKEKARSLLNGAKNEAAARELLTDLFPKLTSAFERDFVYGDGSYAQWAKSRRVSIDRNFNRYFSLRLPDNTISATEFEELLEHAGDRSYVDKAFADLRNRGLLDSLVSRLDEVREDLPVAHIEVLAGALFDLGDELEEGLFLAGSSSFVACWRAASWYFQSIEDPEERSRRFLSTLEGSQGLSVPATLIGLDEDRRKKNERQRLTLTDEDLPKAKEIWFSHLRAALGEPATFLATPHALRNLYTARRYGKLDEIGAWVQQTIRTPPLLMPFLKAFVTTSHSWGMADRVARATHRLSIKYLADFVDLDELSTALAALDKTRLAPDEVALIDEFERNRHKPFKEWPDDEDED